MRQTNPLPQPQTREILDKSQAQANPPLPPGNLLAHSGQANPPRCAASSSPPLPSTSLLLLDKRGAVLLLPQRVGQRRTPSLACQDLDPHVGSPPHAMARTKHRPPHAMARTKHQPVRKLPRKKLQFRPSGGAGRRQETDGAGTSASPRRAGRRAAPAAAEAASGQQRKPHRFRPGTVALREIRMYQKTVEFLIPFAPFVRLVREVTEFFNPDVTCWTPQALVAIQEAAEYHIVEVFEMANHCAIHAKRVTVMREDFDLAKRIGRNSIGRNMLI